MANTPSIKVDGLDQVAEAFGDKGVMRVRKFAQQSVNRGAARGRTQLIRIVTSSVNLPRSKVADRIDTQLASGDSLTARIVSNERPVLLSEFGAKQRFLIGRDRKMHRQGVYLKVAAGGTVKYMPGAFFITLRSGATGLAIPKNPADRSHGRKVKVLYGPSVDQVFESNRLAVMDDLQQWTADEIERRILSQLFP